MPQQVVNTAVLTCTFGLGPSTLNVLPVNRVMSGSQPAANIMDHKPLVNINPFPMCASPANPAVASATAAAMGVLTPMPCIPNTPAPWVPGAANVLIAGMPALDNVSVCNCVWGGVIQVGFAGQATEMIP